jgi:hypothetical protein
VGAAEERKSPAPRKATVLVFPRRPPPKRVTVLMRVLQWLRYGNAVAPGTR